MQYFHAFWVGGLICAIAQILIDKTKLTPGRILVLFVVAGAILGGFGIYEPLVQFAGAGATVPIVGFGNVLAQGAIKGVQEHGFLGVLTGGAESDRSHPSQPSSNTSIRYRSRQNVSYP